jgi:hypothetical protein
LRIGLADLSKRSGVLVLPDATVENERAPMPSDSATYNIQNVDSHIAAILEELPEGITWAKFYLPPPPKGKKWTGEDLAAYALGQSRLYGTVGGAVRDGMIEIMGKEIPVSQAEPIFAALNLQPVYLVTRRTGKGSFQGTWNATYGELRLKQSGSRVYGNYTGNDGVIEGRLRNGVLDFTWVERANNTRGAGQFSLADDGQSFEGTWWYDSDPLEERTRKWTGQRTSYTP